MSCSVGADALWRAWRTPAVGAVSCSSTGPGGHCAPAFVIRSLGWLSMALHTSLVRAWWGAKEATARRRRWHASGVRMGCEAATVIHLHAVSGTITPHSTVPMPSAWRGEIRARVPALLPPPYPGRSRLQAAEQGHAGEERLWEGPLDGLGGMGQGAHGQIPQREDPGVR